LARTTGLHVELISASYAADIPGAERERLVAEAAFLSPDDGNIGAARRRGLALSHSEWIARSRMRIGLRQRWQDLFREVDVVLCPVTPTTAFPHDHSPRWERCIDIDGQSVSYGDQAAWLSIASLTGFPATLAPIERTARGLPVGIQIIGGYLTDRTTIAFAGLLEAAFGGFALPPL
jgi:amidase